MTKFTYAATELIFNCDPLRGDTDNSKRLQPLGRYSDGSVVTYDKSDRDRSEHALPFTRLNGVSLDGLLDFIDEVQGVRTPFTWTDHLGTDHTVKFSSSSIKHLQTGPDQYRATITLIERVSL